MSYLSLSFTLVFILIALFLSAWQKLRLEKELLVATVRAALQLLAVGFILKVVFKAHNLLFILAMIAVMLLVAAQNATRRGQGIPHLFWRILLTLTLIEIISQALLLGLGIIQPQPRYVIPISGMIIGNGMIIVGLFLNRFLADTRAHLPEIWVYLALGASARQAILPTLKQSIRASMIPTIDSAKTIGLVQLPGMMTGMIIGGASPIEAVRYQVLIIFTLIATAAMTSIGMAFLTYPSLFTSHVQIVLPREKGTS